MNGIGKRIRAMRKARGLTQEQFASACGWEGNGRISNYEKGLREPGVTDLVLMAGVLGVPVSDLLADGGSAPIPGNTNGNHDRSVGADVPVIPFATLPDVSVSQDSDPGATTARSWTICPVKHGVRTFCTQVMDDAMACMDSRAIHKGSWVHVDPDQTPSHDQAVVARLASGSLVVAQYMEQAGRRWLHFLNPAYPPLAESFELIGRIIYVAVER